MDRENIYILETAGKEWVYKKVKEAAISNRLTIRMEDDVYSEGKCDFVKKHLEPVYSYFSKSEQRHYMCSMAVKTAENLQDMFKAMRQHSHHDNPMAKASVSSPCMHYGSLIGDHTTQSMAVELLDDGQIRIWVTGGSLPCMSIFKPFLFGNECVIPVFKAGNDAAKSYWFSLELFKREMLGKSIPFEYYNERDEIENQLINMVKNADREKMNEISKNAIELEISFVDKWKNTKLDDMKTSLIFNTNWKKKNEKLKYIIADYCKEG